MAAVTQLFSNRDILVSSFERSGVTATVTAARHDAELIESFAKFAETEDYLDVTFICANNQKVKAHKLVLMAVSPFLKELLTNWDGPSNDIQISLPDISHQIMKLVLDFLYIGHMNLDLEEMTEFKSIVKTLKIQLDGAVIKQSTYLNTSTACPPPLILLTEKDRRELRKAEKLQPKIVETVCLNSQLMYVANEEATAEEENEPTINVDGRMTLECSNGVTHNTQPQHDPLNIPDLYFVRVETQKQTGCPVDKNIATPRSLSNQDQSSKECSSLSETIEKIPTIKMSPDSNKACSSKIIGFADAGNIQHSTRAFAECQQKTETTNEKCAPQSSPIKCDQKNDSSKWLHELERDDIVEHIQQFDLDTTGSTLSLHSRLVKYELHSVTDSSSTAEIETKEITGPSGNLPTDGGSDEQVNFTGQKRKMLLKDISFKLKQPRVVIRDIAKDIALLEKMRVNICKSTEITTDGSTSSQPEKSESNQMQSSPDGTPRPVLVSPVKKKVGRSFRNKRTAKRW